MTWSEATGREGFLEAEVRGAEFGDRRLTRRLELIAGASIAAPSSSFPEMSGGDAALEGTYRFLNNERVTPESILAPHVRSTVRRVQAAETVIVAHDTTEVSFGSNERGDLGLVGCGESYGFAAHVSLAVLAGEERIPLGVLDVTTFNRPFGSPRLLNGRNKAKPENTTRRWFEQVKRVRAALGDAPNVIHVMDREADDYATLSQMASSGERFVVRQATDRRIRRHLPEKVRSHIAAEPLLATREVDVSARRKSNKTGSPPGRRGLRAARSVQLEVRAGRVEVQRTRSAGGLGAPSLQLNLVVVEEMNPPAGCEPICWWLWTNEPVDSADQVMAVVDAYRSRWAIEEYFKALKTGCALEHRQLESEHALQNAMAVFVPVAWRLLLLRNLSRHAPSAPASIALTLLQIQALRGYLRLRLKQDLPQRPSARQAMLAVAKLGGHISNNGDPGWIVLGRGLDRLLDIELGLAIASPEM
jgi:hypothetical protein